MKINIEKISKFIPTHVLFLIWWLVMLLLIFSIFGVMLFPYMLRIHSELMDIHYERITDKNRKK